MLMVTIPLPREGRPGTTAFIARQIDSLRALGLDVDVVEADGGRKAKYVHAARIVRRSVHRYDVVHAHYGFCGWVARAQLARPVVVSFLGSDVVFFPGRTRVRTVWRRVETRSNRLLARIVDRVIVKSDEMAHNVGAAQPRVIPNGVDLRTFVPRDRAEARRELGWPVDGARVLFAGSPDSRRKSFPLARAAVDEASRLRGQPLELVALRDVRPERVPALMNASDVVVLTSLAEGSPNVVKEAMACNVPVVSVPVGDVPYLLEGVRRCRVVPRNARSLAEALVEVLSDPGPTDGRQMLESKGLDLETVARRILGVYQEVVGA